MASRRFFSFASRVAPAVGRLSLPVAAAAFAGGTATTALCREWNMDTVYGAGQAIGEGLRGELWKARHDNVHVLELDDDADVVKLHLTAVRNKDTPAPAFRRAAHLLLRAVMNEAISTLPFDETEIETPNGYKYEGVTLEEDVKILLPQLAEILREGDEEHVVTSAKIDGRVTGHATKSVRFEALPADVKDRHVFVVTIGMRTAQTTLEVVKALEARGVDTEHIVVVSFLATPSAIDLLCKHSRKMNIVCAAVEMDVDDAGNMVPGIGAFDMRYAAT